MRNCLYRDIPSRISFIRLIDTVKIKYSDHLDVFDAIKAVVTLLHILDLKADMLIPTDIALTLRKLVAIPFGVVGDIAGAYGTVRPI